MSAMEAIEVTPELKAVMAEYESKFNDDFPAIYIGSSTEERIARARACIATNTPVPESEYEHLLGCAM
ncbi:hypothetical protein FACS1894216_01050 [Synergistales bacterium]|nr:hypothetical protein FACS1894216_01050 [Synergistales bacterium]